MENIVRSFIHGIDTLNIALQADEPLSQHTSMRCGGNAELYLQPKSIEALQTLLETVHTHALSCAVLGSGTNIIAADEGVRGIIISTELLDSIEIEGSTVTVESGCSWNSLCRAAAQSGLGGFEAFYGLPGTVGGAVFGNAGCFGSSVSDRLVWVEKITEEHLLTRDRAEELEFSYRHSPFMEENSVITKISFTLEPGKEEAALIREQNSHYRFREARGHFLHPSAGSVFKRPSLRAGDPYTGVSAGELIDRCGLKGETAGGARIAEYHGNFIINPEGRATASEINSLIEIVKTRVKAYTGIELECEIRNLHSNGHISRIGGAR